MTATDLGLQVEAPELASAQIEQVSFFPDQDGLIVNAADQIINVSAQGLTLQMQRGYLAEVEQVSGVLVIREKLEGGAIAQAFTIKTAIAPTAASPASVPPLTLELPPTATLPLWQVFAFAWLG